MRTFFVLLAIGTVAACSSQPVDTATACSTPRPQVCTLEYNPSCGQLSDGTLRDYSSPCNACADDKVTAVMPGKCPDESDQ